MTRTQKVQDLVEEAKTRTVLWVIFIAGFAYLLSLTSSSILCNVPIATFLVVVLRYLSFELELRKRVQAIQLPSHLAHLLKHQICLDDPALHSPPVSTRWRRKIDSPVVEAAVDEFTCHIVREFVTDLWYCSLTPDQDVPEQLRVLINDVIGEVAQRVKRINLINLLTRDVVDLVGNHLDLFRQAKATVGTRLFGILSSEEREKKLKQVLLDKKQLHPALLSPELECKVLQQLTSGIVAILLRPQDAHCALMRCLARELLACAVLRPIMNFASPSFINEVIEQAVLSSKEKMENKKAERSGTDESFSGKSLKGNASRSSITKDNRSLGASEESLRGGGTSKTMEAEQQDLGTPIGTSNKVPHGSQNNQLVVQGDWAQVLDVVTQRRARTLAPENLDNLWAKGRNYKKKESVSLTKAGQAGPLSGSRAFEQLHRPSFEKADSSSKEGILKASESQDVGKSLAVESSDARSAASRCSELTKADKNNSLSEPGVVLAAERYSDIKQSETNSYNFMESQVSRHPLDAFTGDAVTRNLKQEIHDPTKSVTQHRRTRSSNTGLEGWQKLETPSAVQENSLYYWDAPARVAASGNQLAEDAVWLNDPLLTTGLGLSMPTAVSKLNCWVVGAHLEKTGSKTFAVYSIAVTDSDNKTWFVERRFRNFEQLHRRLRDLPQYNLQLPPKRFLSSNLDDSFVRDRCILLDKYLKDLLCIPSIAELHEVWDFLSVTSKNYAFSKSPSVIKTLAVNVDDAVDDMFRQLRGVSDGIIRRVSGPTLSSSDLASATANGSVSKLVGASETASFQGISWGDGERSGHASDDEYGGLSGAGQDENSYLVKGDGWHSDSELHVERHLSGANSNMVAQRRMSNIDRNGQRFDARFEGRGSDAVSPEGSMAGSEMFEDELAVPPEWTPPKLSVPLLNLVDSIFQLQRRGWIRRQVFWMAKQVLQLVMGDAIDDWLVAQIRNLRRDDVVASTIQLVHEVLWPDGVFISKGQQSNLSNSTLGQSHNQDAEKGTDQSVFFELQLEATRRASVVHEIIVDGAPTALVSLIGKRQYTRCAKDIYYFLQSTVCLKQLAYSLLEVLLTATFPELQNLVLDIRHVMI